MRRILWLALALCLLSALLPAAVYASGSAALQVAREDGGAVSCADGVWLLEDGGYTVRGTARDFERVRIAGDVTLTLDGASILAHHDGGGPLRAGRRGGGGRTGYTDSVG